MATIPQTTLLDLVQTVNAFAASDAEVVATVAYLINSGKVRLCGNFAGAKIDLAESTKTIAYRRPHWCVSRRNSFPHMCSASCLRMSTRQPSGICTRVKNVSVK